MRTNLTILQTHILVIAMRVIDYPMLLVPTSMALDKAMVVLGWTMTISNLDLWYGSSKHGSRLLAEGPDCKMAAMRYLNGIRCLNRARDTKRTKCNVHSSPTTKRSHKKRHTTYVLYVCAVRNSAVVNQLTAN